MAQNQAPDGIVYMDHAGTTPLAPEVLRAMTPYFTQLFGNPSSIHTVGQAGPLRPGRSQGERVARVLKCRPREIVFTGGGTESDNAAIDGVATALQETGNHIVTSSVEHHAVSCTPASIWSPSGFEVTYLPVDCVWHGAAGGASSKAITEKTTLVSVMYANNEIGT